MRCRSIAGILGAKKRLRGLWGAKCNFGNLYSRRDRLPRARLRTRTASSQGNGAWALSRTTSASVPMQAGRRRLLFGRAAASDPLLPPWARPVYAFAKACTRCGDCAAACPTRIIDATGLFPVVDFARGECTFCGDCVRACPEPAYDRAAFDDGARPWTLVATIGVSCLARANVVCRTCGDACADRAIRFPPMPGTVPVPHLDAAACTGCGACVGVCPANAITVAASSMPRAAVGGLQ